MIINNKMLIILINSLGIHENGSVFGLLSEFLIFDSQ